MAKGIKRKLKHVSKMADKAISGHAKRGGLYAGALASEGYNGGYRDAIQDVLLALNGAPPCRKPEWWPY